MEDLIPIVAIFFVIGVPVMSVAAHFVLRPLLRELTQAIRGGKASEIGDMKERLARLETHLLEQGRQLDQLVDAEMFRRELEEGTRREGRLRGERAPHRFDATPMRSGS